MRSGSIEQIAITANDGVAVRIRYGTVLLHYDFIGRHRYPPIWRKSTIKSSHEDGFDSIFCTHPNSTLLFYLNTFPDPS